MEYSKTHKKPALISGRAFWGIFVCVPVLALLAREETFNETFPKWRCVCHADCFPSVLLINDHFMRSLFNFFFFFSASQYIPQRAYSSAGYWLMVLLCVPFNFAINQQGVETTNLKRIDLFIWLDSLERKAVLVISVWSWGGQDESMGRNTALS